MERLCKLNQINGFSHNGFWQTVDNMKDKKFLNSLYILKKGPWNKKNKIWKNVV